MIRIFYGAVWAVFAFLGPLVALAAWSQGSVFTHSYVFVTFWLVGIISATVTWIGYSVILAIIAMLAARRRLVNNIFKSAFFPFFATIVGGAVNLVLVAPRLCYSINLINLFSCLKNYPSVFQLAPWSGLVCGFVGGLIIWSNIPNSENTSESKN